MLRDYMQIPGTRDDEMFRSTAERGEDDFLAKYRPTILPVLLWSERFCRYLKLLRAPRPRDAAVAGARGGVSGGRIRKVFFSGEGRRRGLFRRQSRWGMTMGFGCFVALLAVDSEEILLEIFLGDPISHDRRRSSVVKTWSCSGGFCLRFFLFRFTCFATFYAVDLRTILPHTNLPQQYPSPSSNPEETPSNPDESSPVTASFFSNRVAELASSLLR